MESLKNIKIILARHIRWLELGLMTAILITVLGKDIQSVPFFGDESNWITTSYFAGPFFEGDLLSPVWGENYWTKGQPPIARYIIGISRRIGGFRAKDLNSHWKFDLTYDANINRGAMPSPDLLWWSRLPMIVLAVVSGVLLFWLASKAAGRLAGYAVLILFMTNSYFLTTLRRAMSESPLLVFVLLTAFAGYQAMCSWRRVYPDSLSQKRRSLRPVIWFFLMGNFCGLAAGAKLNGMSVLMAGLGLCVLFPIIGRKTSHQIQYAAFYACVLILSAGVTFVSMNPFLYESPLKRTHMMIQERLNAMSLQQEAYPAASIKNSSRIQIIRQRIFARHATLHFSGGELLNLLLCAVGLTYLVCIAWEPFRNPDASDAATVILLFGFASTIPALFTPLDWDRYFLLPVVFSTTLIAAGIACAVKGIIACLPAGWPRLSISPS